jgi:hypothetical protein
VVQTEQLLSDTPTGFTIMSKPIPLAIGLLGLVSVAVALSVLPAQGVKLYGTVEHKAKLTDVGPGFRVGAVFKETAAVETSANQWFEVADWMGGRWVEGPTRLISEYDYKLRFEKKVQAIEPGYVPESVKWGWQKDRNGGVWQYCTAPYSYSVKNDLFTEHLYVMEIEGIGVSPESCIVRFIHKNIRVNNKTGRITDVFQLDALHTFVRRDNDHLVKLCSTKYFDENGCATRLTKDACLLTRVEPYIQADVNADRDMKAMFSQFLSQVGRGDLIPDGRSRQPGKVAVRSSP